jgi:hypothetical protein
MPRSPKTPSQRQEAELAKINNGRVQSGSGNGRHNKSDVDAGQFLIEAKCRNDPAAKQITIKLADLEKNTMEALVSNKYGILSFKLGGRHWYITDIPPIAWGDI